MNLISWPWVTWPNCSFNICVIACSKWRQTIQVRFYLVLLFVVLTFGLTLNDKMWRKREEMMTFMRKKTTADNMNKSNFLNHNRCINFLEFCLNWREAMDLSMLLQAFPVISASKFYDSYSCFLMPALLRPRQQQLLNLHLSNDPICHEMYYVYWLNICVMHFYLCICNWIEFRCMLWSLL
jgi:hypothetical protein